MQRYFINNEDFKNSIIKGEDVFHITKVMRMQKGDKIITCNMDGEAYVSVITSIDTVVSFDKVEELKNTELSVDVYIAQALVKGDKMDYVVQKSTELGVRGIIPVETKRCIVKLDEKDKSKRVDRWQKIAKEASEQSHRCLVPKIYDVVNLKNLSLNFDHLVVAYEESAKTDEMKNFKSIVKNLTGSILVLIGPEGGLDDSEVNALVEKGFVKAGLGKRILRTETASSFVLSSIIYEKELGE